MLHQLWVLNSWLRHPRALIPLRILSCAQQGSGQGSLCGTRAAGTLVPDLAGIR